MTDPNPQTEPVPKRGPLRKLSGWFSSKTIHQRDLSEYRSAVKAMYDGPQGGVLKFVSQLSLHEPLLGRLIRKRVYDLARFGSILDIGSGAGQVLRHLLDEADAETLLVATDLSHRMLQRARSRVDNDRSRMLPTQYLSADLHQLPFGDATFEAVTCGWVLEHLPDPLPGLREMARVLKPGGSLLLLASEDSFLGSIVTRAWSCRTYDRQALREACETAGLPWERELWFTRAHRAFKMGGIVVEAKKAEAAKSASPTH